jgi:hypothetical protein
MLDTRNKHQILYDKLYRDKFKESGYLAPTWQGKSQTGRKEPFPGSNRTPYKVRHLLSIIGHCQRLRKEDPEYYHLNGFDHQHLQAEQDLKALRKEVKDLKVKR